jgi:hypothetical protein
MEEMRQPEEGVGGSTAEGRFVVKCRNCGSKTFSSIGKLFKPHHYRSFSRKERRHSCKNKQMKGYH